MVQQNSWYERVTSTLLKKKLEATILGKLMVTLATVLWDMHGVILLRRLVLFINTVRQLDLTLSVCCQKELMLRDSAPLPTHRHIADTTVKLLNTWLWDILLPSLLQSWFDTIGLPSASQMKNHVRSLSFQTDESVEVNVRRWRSHHFITKTLRLW